LPANGICNTLGRAATVVSPFVVGYLMVNYGLPGVIWLMIGLFTVGELSRPSSRSSVSIRKSFEAWRLGL